MEIMSHRRNMVLTMSDYHILNDPSDFRQVANQRLARTEPAPGSALIYHHLTPSLIPSPQERPLHIFHRFRGGVRLASMSFDIHFS